MCFALASSNVSIHSPHAAAPLPQHPPTALPFTCNIINCRSHAVPGAPVHQTPHYARTHLPATALAAHTNWNYQPLSAVTGCYWCGLLPAPQTAASRRLPALTSAPAIERSAAGYCTHALQQWNAFVLMPAWHVENRCLAAHPDSSACMLADTPNNASTKLLGTPKPAAFTSCICAASF